MLLLRATKDCGYDLLKLRGPGDVAAGPECHSPCLLVLLAIRLLLFALPSPAGMARMVVAAAAAAEAMDAEDSEDHSETRAQPGKPQASQGHLAAPRHEHESYSEEEEAGCSVNL